MKEFFKAIGVAAAIFAAVVAALAVLDDVCNKNRIRAKYIACGNGNSED